MMSLGVSPLPPPPRKSLANPSPQPFQATTFPPSPSFRQSHKIVEGGINCTKFPLSSREEKHVDTCMVMNTAGNKTRTKYYKNVQKSQFLIIFGKRKSDDFFIIRQVIEYLFN